MDRIEQQWAEQAAEVAQDIEFIEELDLLESAFVEDDVVVEAVKVFETTTNSYVVGDSNSQRYDSAYVQYMNPFLFNLLSGPSVVVLEVEPMVYASSSAASVEDVAKLEQRIVDLETSNLLLAADFDANAEAFWTVCTYDVMTLCDSSSLEKMNCFYRQTAEATQCLATVYTDLQSADCRLGVERMASWLQIHGQQYDGDVDASDSSYYYNHGSFHTQMAFFLHFLFFFVFFLCCFRCCAKCAAARRRKVAQKRADDANASVNRINRLRQLRKKLANMNTTSDPASPCERGEIVRGTPVNSTTTTTEAVRAEPVVVRGVPLRVDVEDGKHYL